MTDNRLLALVPALLAGLAAVAAVAVLFGSSAAASPNGQEMDLKNSGQAWELNKDANGHLWISDYQAGEIWHLNPATGVYTAYRGLSGASDGRLDANGDLWWVDYDNYRFGRLELDSNTRTIWPLTGTVASAVTGLNFDDQGRVWIPDEYEPELYRFDPQSNEFCHFTWPPFRNVASTYIESHDGYLWLADAILPYVYRLDPADGSYTQWTFPKGNSPRGMTFDDDGNMWWAGFNLEPALFELDPDRFFVTYYNLPDESGEPVMVDAWHNLIYFSDYSGRFGRLDPGRDTGNVLIASWSTATLQLVGCYGDWQPLQTASTQKSTGSATWVAGVYTSTVTAAGWQLYQLPQSDPESGPWGIRAGANGVWVVDQVRQKLVHVPWQKLYLPVNSR